MVCEKWDERWEGVPGGAGCVPCRAPGTMSRKWWLGGGPGDQKGDMLCEKWDEGARGGLEAGETATGRGQWNWAVSVEPARARVALSGLSAVETTSK
jgi:hypothetical protein